MYSFAIELSPQKKKDGTQALLLRITRDRKHKRVVTGFYVTSNQFTHTSEHGQWVTDHPDSENINHQLSDLLHNIGQTVEKMRKKRNPVTLDALALWVKGRYEESFLVYAEREIERYNERGKYRTYRRYTSALTKLKEYRDDEDLFFSDLTTRLIKSYRIYLEGLGNSSATIHADLSCFKVLINKAISEGLFPIQDNPFLSVKLNKPQKKAWVYLTKEEVDQVALFETDSKHELIQHLFLFSIYMGGLKFSDLARVKWENVKQGRLVIYRQSDTKTPLSLKIHEKAQKIMRKYQRKTWSTNDYIFPVLTTKKQLFTQEQWSKEISSKNAQANLKLKALMQAVGIEKKITFTSARHTFAYQASEFSDDVNALSVVLGHSNVGETELYIRQLKNTDEDDLLQKTFY